MTDWLIYMWMAVYEYRQVIQLTTLRLELPFINDPAALSIESLKCTFLD